MRHGRACVSEAWRLLASANTDDKIHERCVRDISRDPLAALKHVVRAPPAYETGLRCVMNAVYAANDRNDCRILPIWCDAWAVSMSEAWSTDAPTDAHLKCSALGYAIGMAGGRRDVMDDVIGTAMTALTHGDHSLWQQVPADWRGRATALGHGDIFDRLSLDVTPSIGTLCDTGQARRMLRLAMDPSGLNRSSDNTSAILLSHADAVADLGVSTSMRAVSMLLAPHRNRVPYDYMAMVRCDWNRVEPEERHMVQAYALRTLMCDQIRLDRHRDFASWLIGNA